MKKQNTFILLLAVMLVLFGSCASNKIDESILEGNVFEVTEISYTPLAIYNARNLTSYDIKDVYQNLPFEEIKENFYSLYGYELSFDLYDENDYENFVDETIKFYDTEVQYKTNKKQSPSKQTVSLSFSIDQVYGYLHWGYNITLPNGKTLGTRADLKKWSMEEEIVDQDNAAQISYKTNANIVLERIDDVNIYAFMDDNKAEDGVFYVPADQEVTIIYSIYDAGNAFVAGGSWEHQEQTFTFEKDKKYKFTYTIDRNHFLAADWTVSMDIVEL
jgi:hypothetical protein